MRNLIDITPEESAVIGELMDLIANHINEYELTSNEIQTLNKADEILYRIWFLHRNA